MSAAHEWRFMTVMALGWMALFALGYVVGKQRTLASLDVIEITSTRIWRGEERTGPFRVSCPLPHDVQVACLER